MPGRVKTRLTPAYTAAEAADLALRRPARHAARGRGAAVRRRLPGARRRTGRLGAWRPRGPTPTWRRPRPAARVRPGRRLRRTPAAGAAGRHGHTTGHRRRPRRAPSGCCCDRAPTRSSALPRTAASGRSVFGDLDRNTCWASRCPGPTPVHASSTRCRRPGLRVSCSTPMRDVDDAADAACRRRARRRAAASRPRSPGAPRPRKPSHDGRAVLRSSARGTPPRDGAPRRHPGTGCRSRTGEGLCAPATVPCSSGAAARPSTSAVARGASPPRCGTRASPAVGIDVQRGRRPPGARSGCGGPALLGLRRGAAAGSVGHRAAGRREHRHRRRTGPAAAPGHRTARAGRTGAGRGRGPAGTSERTRLRLASVGRLSRSVPVGQAGAARRRTVSQPGRASRSTRPGRRLADGSSRCTAPDRTGARARGATAGSLPADLLAQPVTRAVADRRVRLRSVGRASRSCSSPGCSPTPPTTRAWAAATTGHRAKGLLGIYLFDWPTDPVWLYRAVIGVHVLLGLTLLPVVLAKLWSVIPKLFAWPPVESPAQALERLSLVLLVGGAALRADDRPDEHPAVLSVAVQLLHRPPLRRLGVHRRLRHTRRIEAADNGQVAARPQPGPRAAHRSRRHPAGGTR